MPENTSPILDVPSPPMWLLPKRRAGKGWASMPGHDLSLVNLHYYLTRIPWTDEVSIGHALICDALYYGLENTVQLYRREL